MLQLSLQNISLQLILLFYLNIFYNRSVKAGNFTLKHLCNYIHNIGYFKKE